jgi:hypothetical protein
MGRVRLLRRSERVPSPMPLLEIERGMRINKLLVDYVAEHDVQAEPGETFVTEGLGVRILPSPLHADLDVSFSSWKLGHFRVSYLDAHRGTRIVSKAARQENVIAFTASGSAVFKDVAGRTATIEGRVGYRVRMQEGSSIVLTAGTALMTLQYPGLTKGADDIPALRKGRSRRAEATQTILHADGPGAVLRRALLLMRPEFSEVGSAWNATLKATLERYLQRTLDEILH